jgi:hypothetical protein
MGEPAGAALLLSASTVKDFDTLYVIMLLAPAPSRDDFLSDLVVVAPPPP